MEKKEVRDYAVGGWDSTNNCSCSLTNLINQLRAAGISHFKFADPITGNELAATEWIDNPDPDSVFGLTVEEFDAECERLTAAGYKLENYDDGVAAVRYQPLADGWVVLDSWHHTTIDGVGYRVAIAIRTEDFNRIDYHNQPPHRGV